MRRSTRRVRLLLAMFTMLVVLSATVASPAMARHDHDGWWDDCEWVIVGWHWIPTWWGWDWDWNWVLVCNPHHNWWDDHDKHDDKDRDHDNRWKDPWWW